MAITPAAASSTSSAATTAAAPFFDPVDAVNSPAGQPTQEIWPGAVDPLDYVEGSGPRPPGEPGGPPYGSWSAQPFTGTVAEQAPGGGYQDTAWQTGHDGPQAAWDSSAGAPFAPSGPVNPLLHGEDTGGVFNREYVVPAGIGRLTRRTTVGQTTIWASGDQLTRDKQTSPNDRLDFDQYQVHDPNGHDPWEIPYAERKIENNLAYEATPISPFPTTYSPAGALSDRAPFDYAAEAYEVPPDPVVGIPAAAMQSPAPVGEGWVL
jgi:hypothetical protein